MIRLWVFPVEMERDEANQKNMKWGVLSQFAILRKKYQRKDAPEAVTESLKLQPLVQTAKSGIH